MRRQSDEAYLSAEPYSSEAETRLSIPYEDEWWTEYSAPTSHEGSEASRRHCRFEVVMALRTGRFGRSDRLLHSRDYRRVSQRGSRAASSSFVLLVAPLRGTDRGKSPRGRRRLGVTVSRRVGGAVTRNRVKRRIREWFRYLGDEVASDVELVVIARRAAADLDCRTATAELAQLFEVASGALRR